MESVHLSQVTDARGNKQTSSAAVQVTQDTESRSDTCRSKNTSGRV